MWYRLIGEKVGNFYYLPIFKKCFFMIDAIELRIGNIFYPINRNAEVNMYVPIPFVVTEVTQIDVKAYRHGESLHKVLKYSTFCIIDINPIPLNQEILIKCGFGINMTETAWWDKEQNIIISQKDNRFYYAIWGGDFDEPTTEEICELKYLHQLQNLYFDLTGKELEIKEL